MLPKIFQKPYRRWLKLGFLALLAVVLLFVVGFEGAFFWVLFASFILFTIDSKYTGQAALLCLIVTPILLALGKTAQAEQVAVYAFFLLVITVAVQMVDLKRNHTEVEDVVLTPLTPEVVAKTTSTEVVAVRKVSKLPKADAERPQAKSEAKRMFDFASLDEAEDVPLPKQKTISQAKDVPAVSEPLVEEEPGEEEPQSNMFYTKAELKELVEPEEPKLEPSEFVKRVWKQEVFVASDEVKLDEILPTIVNEPKTKRTTSNAKKTPAKKAAAAKSKVAKKPTPKKATPQKPPAKGVGEKRQSPAKPKKKK